MNSGVKVTILIAVVSVAGLFIHSMVTSTLKEEEANPTLELKVAIVDQLSLTHLNQCFIATARNLMEQGGYAVDYYPGEEVTVEFYKTLATRKYNLIILRVHSTTGGQPVVAFFTSESYYKWKYTYEQLTDQVGPVCYSEEEGSKGVYYFGITQKFITLSMEGGFQETVIVMMGCEGLSNTKMAEAFIERGAKAYIGWEGAVLASHTDQATICLLRHIVTEKQAVGQAIENTMEEVGPDPAFKSTLTYYSSEGKE